MLATSGLIVFLIGDRKIYISSLEYIFEDFLEDNHISDSDRKEIQKIKLNPQYLTQSPLYSRLKYYVLPFFSER